MTALAGLFLSGCGLSLKNTYEIIPPGEEAEIRRVAALTTQLQDNRAQIQVGQIFRGVHPKAHGCVAATFDVNEELDEKYQIGLFGSQKKSFDALIRFSNASVLKLPDRSGGKNGSRGMAIKVLDVGGRVYDPDGATNSQDFLMINTPEFVFANVRDYRRLSEILMVTGDDAGLFFAPVFMLDSSGRFSEAAKASFKEFFLTNEVFNDFDKTTIGTPSTTTDWGRTLNSAKIAGKIAAMPVRNPLEVPYFGASPSLLGENHVMKFSAAPCKKMDQAAFENEPNPDYLREALTETLKQSEGACFKFRLQVLTKEEVKGNEQILIEDASIAWDKDFDVEVATITIPPQTPYTGKAVHCEQKFFTPWHALAEHQPLGGINRLRNPVYINSARNRGAEEDPGAKGYRYGN
jgi:hypothetical protein